MTFVLVSTCKIQRAQKTPPTQRQWASRFVTMFLLMSCSNISPMEASSHPWEPSRIKRLVALPFITALVGINTYSVALRSIQSTTGWRKIPRSYDCEIRSMISRIRAGSRLASTNEEESSSEDEMEETSEEISNVPSTTDVDASSSSSSKTKSEPLKVKLRTSIASPLIDHSIEFTASKTRTVASFKQVVSRQFRGRPPQDIVVLTYKGRVLQDDMLLGDIVDEDDDEDDEDEKEDGDVDTNEEEENLKKVTFVVDIVPPVDPKFGIDMKERLPSMTTEQILDAYVANLAAMHRNSIELFYNMGGEDQGYSKEKESSLSGDVLDGRSYVNDASPSTRTILKSVAMKNHALSIKNDIIRNLTEDAKKKLFSTSSDDDKGLVEDDSNHVRSVNGDTELRRSIHGKLKKKRGGASMNIKRSLQTNLNIDWATTIRNAFLFLFFGYFGGRNSFSRTVMLLGAPACFFLQARPVKVFLKQIFYFIGEPPAILLSLLPAPQQAIMSCDYNKAMLQLYGEDAANPLIRHSESDSDADIGHETDDPSDAGDDENEVEDEGEYVSEDDDEVEED